ncbi:CoA-binding protein [Patescibacteria group bacterium]|nr:CoA-binding protein [Patescibacteria group bacterium]MBU4162152.1 CoA-binding protein [Patescibacteria group bacterium]
MKLNYLFNPKTIAVIGATDKIGSVGRGLVKNLLSGKETSAKAGARRKIFLVNPNRKKVFGIKTLPSVLEIKGEIDLAVIAVPAQVVLKVTEQCIQKKVKSVIIISSGFAETGTKGAVLQDKVKQALTRANTAFVGPNCLGILRPCTGLNASFAPLTPSKGNIALISQSGALIDAIIDASNGKSWGFSAIISYGNEAGLNLVDFLNWAKNDSKTKVIALYLEGLKNGRQFFEAAKETAIKKPVLILKGGKNPNSKKAVSSHTGALAGESQIYSVAFKQAGLIEVSSIEELLDIAKVLSWHAKCKNGIAIITNGGGAGILAADYCYQFGINLPKPNQATLKKIENSKLMHPGYSKSNPMDIVGDALSNRYEIAISAIMAQKDINGLIVIQTPQTMTEPIKNAKIIIEAQKKWPQKPIVAAFIGGELTEPAVKILEKNHIPNYPDPRRAVIAIKSLISN